MLPLLLVTKGDGIMTFIEKVQPLIDWCTQPHPQDRPRLKRVASANLTLSVHDSESPGRQVAQWFGALIYEPPRGRKRLGGFSGAIPCKESFSPKVAVGQHAQVYFTLAEDRPWMGIQGPGI